MNQSELVKLSFGNLRINVRYTEPFVYYATFIADEYFRLQIFPGDFVIDAGANIGDFSVKASRLVGPTGKVIAIEPDPENIPIIRENLEINNISNVIILHNALLNSEDNVILKGQGVGATIALEGSEGSAVKGVTMDKIISDYCLSDSIVLKMDIEGAEKFVFENASFIDKIREVAIELHGKENIVKITNDLKQNGFALTKYSTKDSIVNTFLNILKHPVSFISAEFKTNFVAFKGFLKIFFGGKAIPSVENEELLLLYGKRI